MTSLCSLNDLMFDGKAEQLLDRLRDEDEEEWAVIFWELEEEDSIFDCDLCALGMMLF